MLNRRLLLVVVLLVPPLSIFWWRSDPTALTSFSTSAPSNGDELAAAQVRSVLSAVGSSDQQRGKSVVAGNAAVSHVEVDFAIPDEDGDRLNSSVSVTSKAWRRVAVTVLFGTGNRLSERSRSSATRRASVVDEEDDDDGSGMSGIVDGACVLRHSMVRYQPHDVSLDFVALVPEEEELGRWNAEALRVCGYRMQRVAAPIRVSEIHSPVLRKMILTRPVGLLELRKLASLNMTRYDTVLCIDADIMFVGPYDDLLSPPPGAAWPWRMGKDCNGGLIVYFPQNDGPRHAAAVLNLLRSAVYSPSKGYANTGFGADVDARRGLSGGPMLQGLLPYYTHSVLKRNPRESDGAIPACRHNFYLAKPEFRVCYKYSLADVRSVHFKGGDGELPKPWECAHTKEAQRKVPETQRQCTQLACIAFMRRYHEEQWQMITRCTQGPRSRQVKRLSDTTTAATTSIPDSNRTLLRNATTPQHSSILFGSSSEIGCVLRKGGGGVNGSSSGRHVFIGLPTVLRRLASHL